MDSYCTMSLVFILLKKNKHGNHKDNNDFVLKRNLRSHDTLNLLYRPPLPLPSSSLFLSKANSTSTGQLDKLVSPAALTPESEEEQSLPPQRVSTFRPRPYSMADSNKVPKRRSERLLLILVHNRGL